MIVLGAQVKGLQKENARLKRILADEMLDEELLIILESQWIGQSTASRVGCA